MKSSILLYLIFICLFFFSGASSYKPQTDHFNALKVKPIDLKVNLDQSYINFIGTKPLGQHQGQFKLSEGIIHTKNKRVTGGSFLIDITSLRITDNPLEFDEESRAKLTAHLLSADFFDAEMFNQAKFDITNIEMYVPLDNAAKDSEMPLGTPTHFVTGNLKMIGISKSIRFPAVITMTNQAFKAEAKFNINRTNWDMNYGADESLGDKLIRPIVNIQLHIIADK